MNNMTDEEYVANRGCKCPVCGSTEISGGPVTVDAGSALQEIVCDACHAAWNDVYKLIGYGELET